MKIVISSAHGKHVAGANGYLNEVEESRRVVDEVARIMRRSGAEVIVFHDDVSTTQDENLDRIISFHNSQGPHDYDVSVHFNSSHTTDDPMGTECWYYSEE